ncbi:MAG: histone deacetylase family protein [Candidatus Hadarchaeales archaeon]
MKVIYSENFRTVYSSDPASAPGRMEAIVRELVGFEFVEPEPAREEDILLVHTPSHLERVKALPSVYPLALLAAGAAIKASEFAMRGEPSFALLRPPGHHAGPNSFWGFCYFNNLALSLQRLLGSGRVKRTVILDFDLHYGDGTAAIFSGSSTVSYHHAEGRREEILEGIASFLSREDYDLVAVSAGFDNHEEDWGGTLSTSDYREIGRMVRGWAEEKCGGRRYGVLEGGYNHSVLGRNVRAFLEGFG